MGEKTGAYTVTCEDDPAVFGDRERLARFDAVVFNNPCFNAVPDSQQRANLLAFIRNGGGFVGIHCAAHVTDWPEYAEMLGGFSIGHPWYSAVVRVEDPRHALTRCFPDPTFAHRGEIYVFNRFSRSKSRVMLSMDTTRAPMHIKGSPGPDADIPLGWVRRYGQGRVFYCALGHDAHSFWDPALLRHYLAGIQYAVGDLAADDMPRPDPAPPAKTTR
jgi:type 1 glutamine amidotransferase